MKKNKIIHLIWPPLLIYLVYLLSKLVWYDSLSSLTNDSVHYLVMARHYSPWASESNAIASAWLLQDFPPFFPWLLAFSGAAHSLLYAHLLVAVMGLISLYFYYLLASQWLNDRVLAIFPLLVFSLSPGFLLGLQGILSESLYLLLVLIFLLVYTVERKRSGGQLILVILLLAAIMLTRTTGIALGLAIVAQAVFASIAQKKLQFQPALILLASLVLYLLLMALWGPVKQSHYLGILIQYISSTDLYEAGSNSPVHFSLLTQLKYQLESWVSFWLIHWKTNVFSASYFVILLLALASLSGLFLRLLKNKYDAWYVLFFILILLVWPYPGQLFRLVFPIMPLLLIYAGYAIRKLLELKKENKKKGLLLASFYLTILAATLPSHAFIHARLALASEKQLVPVYEIFRQSSQYVASKQLALQNQMLKDFTHVKDTVPENEKLLYFKPAYLAVLSDRTGVTAPSPIYETSYRSLSNSSGARYIFLTRLHPRNTRLGYSGFQGIEHLDGWTKLVWCSQLADRDLASCLFRIESAL